MTVVNERPRSRYGSGWIQDDGGRRHNRGRHSTRRTGMHRQPHLGCRPSSDALRMLVVPSLLVMGDALHAMWGGRPYYDRRPGVSTGAGDGHWRSSAHHRGTKPEHGPQVGAAGGNDNRAMSSLSGLNLGYRCYAAISTRPLRSIVVVAIVPVRVIGVRDPLPSVVKVPNSACALR